MDRARTRGARKGGLLCSAVLLPAAVLGCAHGRAEHAPDWHHDCLVISALAFFGDAQGVRLVREREAHPQGDWYRSPRGWDMNR
jgi:hypothetical protein